MGATLGTRLLTWLRGELVGSDDYGNRYYRLKGDKPQRLGAGRFSRERRWVIYNGEPEGSKVPPEWHAWKHSMRGNLLESVMGAVVLLVAALFLFFAYNTSQLRSVPGYQVTADFERVDGVREGGDVRISGIKIGSILSQTLDSKTFLAHLT